MPWFLSYFKNFLYPSGALLYLRMSKLDMNCVKVGCVHVAEVRLAGWLAGSWSAVADLVLCLGAKQK